MTRGHMEKKAGRLALLTSPFQWEAYAQACSTTYLCSLVETACVILAHMSLLLRWGPQSPTTNLTKP